MHYYIDGYNLMYRVMKAGDHLKDNRESLIEFLNEKVHILKIDATIVFDAQYRLGYGSRSHLQSFEICFTDQGETADDYILKKIKIASNPREETVVTSDNKLSWRARLLMAHTISVESFIAFLSKKYQSHLNHGDRKEKKDPSRHLSKWNIASEEHAQVSESPPGAGQTIEESFDYYLYHFEQTFKEIHQEKPPKKTKPLKPDQSRKKNRPPKSDQPAESEMDRWLKFFERSVEEEDNIPP